MEGSKKEWLSLSSDLCPEEISEACPPSCHGGCFCEAVPDPSSLGLDPAEQHHGPHGCTNAQAAFLRPRSLLPERGGIAKAVIRCGRAVLIASKCTLPELMPGIYLSPSQTELLFIFLLLCLVGVGKKVQKLSWWHHAILATGASLPSVQELSATLQHCS